MLLRYLIIISGIFGKKDDDLDIYTEEGMENFVDDDAISASEQGFMSGYLGA